MLTLKNISKTFPGFLDPVLNAINLELKQGDFCVIIGANGSGKSTLLKIISGEYEADEGEITIEGPPNIAQVNQDINKGTIPQMTLLENMSLSDLRTKKAKLAFYSRHRQKHIQQVQKLGINLEHYIDHPLATLSGGQRQMIATLMALSSLPRILLLDEHTSALDPTMQEMLMDFTAKSIAEHCLSSLMITHKMEDAIHYGNRLIVMHKGQIVFDVSGEEKFSLKVSELLKHIGGSQ